MQFVIEHLEKSYGDRPVINDASFVFEEGKIYGLLGRNGAGKTTLFNCINGDIKTNAGEFYFLDESSAASASADSHSEMIASDNIFSEASAANSAPLSKLEIKPSDIGYVQSTPNVPEFLTAREFLKFFVEINPDVADYWTRDNARTAAADSNENHLINDTYQNLPSVKTDGLFDIVKIAEGDRDRLLKDFSHGMKNKMQMLIALISRPKLLLLDEPLTSLDVVVSEEMKGLLREHKSGRITIFSTHILDLALDLCDEIVLLSRGKLERVDHSQLDNEEFKTRIIRSLQEEDEPDTVTNSTSEEPSTEPAEAQDA